MTPRKYIFRFTTLLFCIVQLAGLEVYSQNFREKADSLRISHLEALGKIDTLSIEEIYENDIDTIKNALITPDVIVIDSLTQINERSLETLTAPVDTTAIAAAVDSMTVIPEEPEIKFLPNPTRSIWLATVIPGGGQIYNRKYWKLPIIYGGFAGCAYALNWNNQMYKDYSQAYLDIMDNDPETNSYLDLGVPLGDEERFKEPIRKKKDRFRRYRDLSIFAFIGVYLISIIDAYVDAELSDFDISPNLGLKIEPSIMYDKQVGNSFGLQCSFKF